MKGGSLALSSGQLRRRGLLVAAAVALAVLLAAVPAARGRGVVARSAPAGEGSSWTEQAELQAETPAVDDDFGWSAALASGVAAVGAPAASLAR